MSVSIVHKEQDVGETITDETLDVELIEKVDAYGTAAEQLATLMKKLEPLANKVAKLKKELAETGLEAPADETVTLEGVDYDVKMVVRAMKVTDTDRKLLYKTLGSDLYLDLATIAIGDIRKYCTPPQIAEILTEVREGGRTLKVEKK